MSGRCTGNASANDNDNGNSLWHVPFRLCDLHRKLLDVSVVGSHYMKGAEHIARASRHSLFAGC
jgi:hypothetical protein